MALTDNLISYYPLDEASGNAIDAHSTNDLTDTNTVGSATGIISNARDFELGNSEYFTIASNASLVTGDIDFTLTAWVKLESKSTRQMIVTKDDDSGREHHLYYESSNDRFKFTVVGNGVGDLSDSVLGSPSTGTWYFLVAWHDATANTVNLQINNGTASSTSYSGGVGTSSAAFQIGAREYGGFEERFDGLIDEVGFWKRVLTSDERTELYNGGAGLAYPFSAGGATPKAWFGKPLHGPLRRAVA